MENETEFGILYQGIAIVYCECKNCKQPLQYPTERKYNLCPYCGARVKYKEDK